MSDNNFASIAIIIVLTICVALDAILVRKASRIESNQVKSLETESEEDRMRNYAEPVCLIPLSFIGVFAILFLQI